MAWIGILRIKNVMHILFSQNFFFMRRHKDSIGVLWDNRTIPPLRNFMNLWLENYDLNSAYVEIYQTALTYRQGLQWKKHAGWIFIDKPKCGMLLKCCWHNKNSLKVSHGSKNCNMTLKIEIRHEAICY